MALNPQKIIELSLKIFRKYWLVLRLLKVFVSTLVFITENEMGRCPISLSELSLHFQETFLEFVLRTWAESRINAPCNPTFERNENRTPLQ